MSKYYLVHTVLGANPELILKILKDGYLYSGFYSGRSALFGSPTAKYVYFSLLNKDNIFRGTQTFFIDEQILFDRSFRYALAWLTEDSETIKVKYPKDDVYKILKKIMSHIKSVSSNKFRKIMSHEFLIKKKVNLHNYLRAVCCSDILSSDAIEYIKKYYPNVKILLTYPETANELNNILKY